MTSMQMPTTRRRSAAREQLREGVGRSVIRGRLLASLGAVLLCISSVLAGLFIVVLIDAAVVLGVTPRVVLLLALLVGALVAGAVLVVRPWLNEGFNRAAGQQIDRAAQLLAQPVTLGLSLDMTTDDDTLALALIQRAEQRAADVAQSVEPSRAYPMRRLRRQGRWLILTAGLWLLLAVIFPSQFFAMFTRVALPWGGAPPFSLTQLDQHWSPRPPDAGDDVTVSVQPQGLMPQSVQWVRLDEQGNEAERFAMTVDGQGVFSHTLKQVESPIRFQLEALGRHSRTYTITPTPRPPTLAGSDPQDDTTNTPSAGGSTSYDPEQVAARDIAAHPDWPLLKARLDKLLGNLADAEVFAESIDPADADDLLALADQLTDLGGQAKALADDLAAIQGDLPPEAAAALAKLQSTLNSLRSAALPAPPGSSSAADGNSPSPAQWRDQAVEATQADQRRIGQGIGPSDQPTESGIATGLPDGESPAIRDPAASGSYDEDITSSDTGPLPNALMQQVPPSYRGFVRAYFERLADEQPPPPR